MQKYSITVTEDAEDDIVELMAFYEELVDAPSAMNFFNEAMATIQSLAKLPSSKPVFDNRLDIRKIQMKNHKVAIVYIVDDNRFEIIAVRVYHQMQKPAMYRESVRKRLIKLFPEN